MIAFRGIGLLPLVRRHMDAIAGGYGYLATSQVRGATCYVGRAPLRVFPMVVMSMWTSNLGVVDSSGPRRTQIVAYLG